MTHWGWYWKVKRQYTPKTLCSHLMCLDAFALFKITGFAGFNFKLGEKEFNAKLEQSALVVTLESITYAIPWEKQSCHFGGFRYFFRCPGRSCKRRTRMLYGRCGVFLCRKCHNLGYYSQRQVKSFRLSTKKRKLEEKLEASGGNIYQKPKGMRWKAFNELNERIRVLDIESDFALEKEIFQMYGERV